MKKILIKTTVLLFILIIGLSFVSAHGVDVTNDKMIIANDTNGQLVKDIADADGLNVSVYKFTSDGEVEHQLEHMLNNSNKYIIVVAYQDTASTFLEKHPDMSSRLIVMDNWDNDTLKEEMIKMANTDSTNDASNLFLFYGSGIVILLLLIIGGILFVKNKKN